MEPATAYKVLGAVLTFGIGWRRINAPLSVFSEQKTRPFWRSNKEITVQALAKNIISLRENHFEAHDTSPLETKLIQLINNAFEAHQPEQHYEEPIFSPKVKEAAKSSLIFSATFYSWLVVIPAAMQLKDSPTIFLALGSIYGLLLGAALCLVLYIAKLPLKKLLA